MQRHENTVQAPNPQSRSPCAANTPRFTAALSQKVLLPSLLCKHCPPHDIPSSETFPAARSAFFARFQIIFGKGIDKVSKTWYHIRAFKICGCSSVVEHQPSKLVMWVRFPSPAPLFEERTRCSAASHTQKNVRHFLSGMPEFLPTRDFMYL